MDASAWRVLEHHGQHRTKGTNLHVAIQVEPTATAMAAVWAAADAVFGATAA